MQSMIGITKLMLQASIETGFDHTRGSLDCWELCFDELCHAYAVHVRGGDVLSVSRCNGIGVHVRKDLGSQAPCELGSMRMPEPDMTWQGKYTKFTQIEVFARATRWRGSCECA